MTEANMLNVQKILSDAGSIIDKYETLSRETGSSFNIFEIADISTKETTICRVLAELLSTDGRHGHGSAYLEIFLRDYLGLSFSMEELDSAHVHREYYADGRRIDIVIEASGRFIPFEVKIHAGDSVDQCYDYFNFAKTKDAKAKVIYLTLDGHKPSEYSAKGLSEGDILPLSFADDILGWLEKCIALPNTIRKAPVREILIQFSSAIKYITGQLEDKPMNDMIELLSESSQNMRNAKAIADSLEACREEMRIKFFNAFHEKFKGILGREASRPDFDSPDDPKWPSIGYIVKPDAEPGISIVFTLQAEAWTPLFAGFTMAKNGEQFDDSEVSQRLRKRFSGTEAVKTSPYFIFYEILTIDKEKLNLMDFRDNYENYFKLFDKDKFNDIVDKTVEQAKIVLGKLNS